ncbi:MAG: tyrosine-protein phosphatase [Lachnospirales bacterium]
MEIIRLPLEGTSNTRDLGGYIGNGKVFKWGKVYRSDCLSKLTEADKDFLVNRGIKKVIDLRSLGETKKGNNKFENDKRVEYINISLAGDLDPNNPKDFVKMSAISLIGLYKDILTNKKEEVRDVLKEICQLKDGESVIFHCTAGKDRTGVIAMLLLGIVGVTKQDIATNYMQTATNLKYDKALGGNEFKIASLLPKGVDLDAVMNMLASPAENIETTYDFLINEFNSFKDYFLRIGLSLEEVEKLITSLTSDYN